MAGNASVIDIALRVRDDGTKHIRQVGKESQQAGRKVDESFKRGGRTLGEFNRRLDGGSAAVKQFGVSSETAGRQFDMSFDKGGRTLGAFNARLMSTRALFISLGVGAAAYQLAQFSGAAITSASNLEEASSKYETVFMGQVAAADEWVATLTEGYAMSTRESREYLAAVQDLLVPMGMQSTAAAQLSNEIVQLSADLGSFNNRTTEEVMLDIQSALVGNFETMKKYGVVLTATTVQERALAEGYARTKDELSAADKALAAYQIMMEGSTAAIGDMERTADGYANTTKRLDAEWEDFSATMGRRFLPAATKVKGVTADILHNLTEAMQVGATPTGKGLDQAIADAQAKLDQLNWDEEQKEAARQSKREAALARREARRQRWIKKNTAPQNTESARVAAAMQKLHNEELARTPEEQAKIKAQGELNYLLDLKRFEQLEAHQAKMAQVAADSEKALAQEAEAKRKAQAKADKETEKQRAKAEKEAERAAAAEEKRLKYVANRTAEITMSETEFEIRAIEEQARADKKAGVDAVAVASWVAAEKTRILKESEEKRLAESQYWADGAVRGLNEYADAAADVASGVEDAFRSGFRGMEDALLQMVTTGKIEFSDLANSIISDLARIAIRQSITGPLAAGLNSFMGNMFSGGTSFANVGSAPMATSTVPSPMTMAPVMHQGGVVGPGYSHTRAVPGAMFHGAPRFHSGLGPREFPAILEEEEIVIPAARARQAGVRRSGGVTNVTVNIHTHGAAAPARQEQRTSADGNTVDIDLFYNDLEDRLGSRVAQGQGAIADGMVSRFGANPVYGAN